MDDRGDPGRGPATFGEHALGTVGEGGYRAAATPARGAADEPHPMEHVRARRGPDRHRLNRRDQLALLARGEGVMIALPTGEHKVVTDPAELPSEAEQAMGDDRREDETLAALRAERARLEGQERMLLVERQRRQGRAAGPADSEGDPGGGPSGAKADAGGDGGGKKEPAGGKK